MKFRDDAGTDDGRAEGVTRVLGTVRYRSLSKPTDDFVRVEAITMAIAKALGGGECARDAADLLDVAGAFI